MLLAVLALVVVGPKDLPRLMRRIGQFMAQARNLAGEFMAGFDQMAREAELDELRNEIEDLKKLNPINEIKDEVKKVVEPMQDDDYLDPIDTTSETSSDEGETKS